MPSLAYFSTGLIALVYGSSKWRSKQVFADEIQALNLITPVMTAQVKEKAEKEIRQEFANRLNTLSNALLFSPIMDRAWIDHQLREGSACIRIT